MKYRIAKTAGFCGGVRKAFLMVERSFKGKINGERVFILGSLVHNENVMKTVTQMGIKKINTIASLEKGDTVIITAHGVGENIFKEIEKQGAKVFNATCPKVSMVQDCAREYFKKGFEIIIFGNKEHKEVRGITGWCENKAKVVSNFKEVEELIEEFREAKKKKPILLISQTTQNIENFKKIEEMFTVFIAEQKGIIKVVDTICRATFVRQKEALAIAKEMDMVIVVGGKSSSNTGQLWKIAKKENSKTLWIEDPKELGTKKNGELIKSVESIGIISGASTSTEDIEAVAKIVENCD